MELYLALFSALLIGVVHGNDNVYDRNDLESEDNMGKEDQVPHESFGSPVYGPSGISKSANPKSGYPLPSSAIPGVAAGYSGYFSGLGFGYGAPYGRYGALPYSSPYYGYGSPYNAMAYGYGPGLTAGLGYNAGLAYGSPALGRAAYTVYGNGYPGYAGVGYRYGGYNPALLRAPGVPAPVPAAYAGVAAPIPAAYAGVAAPIPAAYANAAYANTAYANAVPVPGPATYANAIPVPGPATYANAIPVPGPAGVPVPASAYRPAVVATQGKDGSLRYTYAPVGQRLPGY